VLVEVHWRAQHHDAAAAALAARRLTPAEWRRAIGSHLAAVVADGRDVRGAVRTLRATQDFAAARRVDAVCATDTGGAPGPDRRPLPRAGDHWPVWPRDPGPCRTALAHRLEPRHFSEPRCPRPCSARSVGTPFRRLDDALGSVVPLEPSDAGMGACVGCSARARRCARDRTTRNRDDLLSHYRGDSPSHYHALDRHLLGLTDEASALGVDRQRSVEVAYYLGLQADVERRLLDAIGGYRVALETNEPTVYETQLLPTARRAGGRAARAPRAARASRAWQPCPPRPTPLVLTPPAGGSPRAVFVGPLTGAHVSAVQASAEG
jgi:hypothetical protein